MIPVDSFMQMVLVYFGSYEEYNGFRNALLVIDYWTGKIAYRAIKSENSSEIEKKLDSIFKKDLENLEAFPSVLKADADHTDFFATYCKKRDIYFRGYTTGHTKFYPENVIEDVKEKLQAKLEEKNSNNWPDWLKVSVLEHNESPSRRLGGLKPSDVSNPESDVRVREALKKTGHYRVEKLGDAMKKFHEKSDDETDSEMDSETDASDIETENERKIQKPSPKKSFCEDDLVQMNIDFKRTKMTKKLLMQKKIYYKVTKVEEDKFTIRRLGKTENEEKTYSANQLVRRKLTSKSNLIIDSIENERTVNRKKKSLLKFKGIGKLEWLNNACFLQKEWI